ncbi:MAG: P-loop NTPase [Clostridia bacterium]|nr:P-loop NTPase [Clostridia bacterium]MBO4428932.1 P-loop NTPase [Clostridia bacterium]
MSETKRTAEIILFTSCKGGVGKSTVCANLAMSLAMHGKRVLMIDCDFGNRCLDILAGLSNEAVYDIGDVTSHRVSPERAVIKHGKNKNLSFVAAPNTYNFSVSSAAFRGAVGFYAKSGEYDFIFLDTPGGIGEPLLLAANVADAAYIVVSPTRAAVRAAEKTAYFLYTKGVKRQRLIVNNISGKKPEDAKKTIISIIDTSRVRLIGAVPYDPEIVTAGDNGILTDELLSEPVTRAFDNIALRTLGTDVPLFYKIKRLKRLR